MIILTIRTDKPEAEVGLYQNEEQLNYLQWQAHRELSQTLNLKIDEILNKSSKFREDIGGIVTFQGPGSFTGLRIGLSVANALAYALSKPIIAAAGERWIEAGLKRLSNGENDKTALPEYGAPAATTPAKK